MTIRRPNIILDALLVNDNPTGVGRSILELTKALSLGTWEFDFTVLATTPDSFEWLADCPGWRVVPCPMARGGTLRKALFTQWELPRLCRRLDGDLLHSLQFVAPLVLPCPSVVTVHDLAWLRFPETVEEPRKTYYRLMVPPSLRKAAAVVTNSEATAHDVRTFYPQCRSLTVTPFGTPSWVRQEHKAMQETPSIGKEQRGFFLFVGTLEPRKNLEGILEAYNLLLNSPRAHDQSAWPSLVLVGGKGWKDSKLRRMMDPLVSSGDLRVLDYCDTGKLKELYLSALALVFPSLHEGFGFPILEAMSFGLPVITSDLGAMAEVAGQHALLVDPNSREDICRGMMEMAQSEKLREGFSHAGPDRARHWSWRATAFSTVAVYKKVLAPGEP
jgi:glycosyltransferase involved in cell wall biosynthesis